MGQKMSKTSQPATVSSTVLVLGACTAATTVSNHKGAKTAYVCGRNGLRNVARIRIAIHANGFCASGSGRRAITTAAQIATAV